MTANEAAIYSSKSPSPPAYTLQMQMEWNRVKTKVRRKIRTHKRLVTKQRQQSNTQLPSNICLQRRFSQPEKSNYTIYRARSESGKFTNCYRPFITIEELEKSLGRHGFEDGVQENASNVSQVLEPFFATHVEKFNA